MISLADFNDTHGSLPSGKSFDNLGAILAVADWLSRRAVAAGKSRSPWLRPDLHDQGPRNSGLHCA